jgi:putative transposase
VVINYRADVFGSVGAAKAFEQVMGEACEMFGWVVAAYVLMRNHFHLALETPEPNLVEGMHWLQSTYATRFIVAAEQADSFRWSSLPRFQREARPKWLVAARWLTQHGLHDDRAGWRHYRERLIDLAASRDPKREHEELCRGWAIGTSGWRKAVAKDLAAAG